MSGTLQVDSITNSAGTGAPNFPDGLNSSLSYVLSAVLITNYTPSSNTPIKFDTVIFDPTSSYSTSTGLFTAPVTGYYSVSFVGILSSGTGDGPYIAINGSSFIAVGSVTSSVYGSGSGIVHVTAGQTIAIHAGNPSQTYNGSGTTPYTTTFSIARVLG